MKGLPPESQRQGLEYGQIQGQDIRRLAASGPSAAAGFSWSYQTRQQGEDFVIPVFRFTARNLREPGQGLADGRIEVALQQRDQLMPDAIAGVAQVAIAAIFPPRLADRPQIGLNLPPAYLQQGPNQLLFRLQGEDAGQAARARSANHAHQD